MAKDGGAPPNPNPFQVLRHGCGEVLFEGLFTGIIIRKCKCKRRVWAGSDGSEIRILFEDAPSRRILPNEPPAS